MSWCFVAAHSSENTDVPATSTTLAIGHDLGRNLLLGGN